MSRKRDRSVRFFTYMVECADKTYYTGFAADLEERVKTHNSGRGAKYTRGRLPVRLVWARRYRDKGKALSEEARIKALTRREKEDMVKSLASAR